MCEIRLALQIIFKWLLTLVAKVFCFCNNCAAVRLSTIDKVLVVSSGSAFAPIMDRVYMVAEATRNDRNSGSSLLPSRMIEGAQTRMKNIQ